MIKLKDIISEIIGEGGKLFGTRAQRINPQELVKIYGELKSILTSHFNHIELTKSLPSKDSFGDIDVVVSGGVDVANTIKSQLGDRVLDYSRNGNIYSVLYKSNTGKNVHIDFIHSDNDEDFNAQQMYLSLGDFSGILGVMARQNGYKYATTGFYKIYIDKSGRHHDILITKNLKDGLKILGYGDVITSYDKIQNNDDVVKFISSSPLFDSNNYKGQTMNSSDRKRVRSGRPSADYIRKSLITLNKHKHIDDPEYFLKKLFPEKYNNYLNKVSDIESYVVPKSKYGGDWIIKNFKITPGPIINQIKLHWKELFGNDVDSQSEETLLKVSNDFLKKL
jgi:hypothetical protein